MTALIASGRSGFAGWGLHPLESAAFARRTPTTEVGAAIHSSMSGLARARRCHFICG